MVPEKATRALDDDELRMVDDGSIIAEATT